MATRLPQYLNYDVVAYLGDTLVCPVSWKDASGVYVNFSSATGVGQIKLKRTDATAVAEFTVALGSGQGNIRFSLTAAQVTALGIGSWVYDIQITDGNNVRTYIVGKLKIIQDVTRP